MKYIFFMDLKEKQTLVVLGALENLTPVEWFPRFLFLSFLYFGSWMSDQMLPSNITNAISK